MKIAVSGSAGIGKSTLAMALADAFGVACIPEYYEELFANTNGLNSPVPLLAREFSRVLDFKFSEQERLGSYVVDRTPADLLNLALRTNLVYQKQYTKAFYERCRTGMADYDLIIIPPWGVIPLQESPQEDQQKKRVRNPWLQLVNHAAISGLVKMFVGEDMVLCLPNSPGTESEWLDVALNRIRQINV